MVKRGLSLRAAITDDCLDQRKVGGLESAAEYLQIPARLQSRSRGCLIRARRTRAAPLLQGLTKPLDFRDPIADSNGREHKLTLQVANRLHLAILHGQAGKKNTI